MRSEKKRKLKIVALICSLACLLSTGVIAAFASSTIETVGEMAKDVDGGDGIATAFSSYKVQDTVRASSSLVGDVQYTVYHNKTSAIKTGYEGTPIVVYTVNHPTVQRVGTDSNKTIITSMLNKGYVVIVLDFLNNGDITTTDIANYTQQFRQDIVNKKVITYSGFPSGNPRETFIAPSGCNVLLQQVFWSIDKHSAEGTLEKIVENWNTDFRTTKGGKLVKWVHSDGTRKKVLDGATWHDADGSANTSGGQYTYVKYTVAETITDCVDPDGSFIDMDLYINVVYPTSPKTEVPVMSLANSSGYPTTSVTSADLRPHSNDFLYNGYANVVFDYMWEPMSRNASWGYYDGSQGNTKDHMNYGLMMYNDKLVNTAAMRYLRNLSLSDKTGEYNFDLDAFGVYGNSKGGWFSYLGEAVLQKELVSSTEGMTKDALETAIDLKLASLVPDRYYNGHDGTTRYQANAGKTEKDGFTVRAGEKQPWLTYDGKEIISGCQLTNACNGSQEEDISEGHVPIFISCNMTDTYNAAYGYSINIYNICRMLDIPLLHFEVPIGHTLTSGKDMNYNVDTYENYFKYVGYFLKDLPIDVAYVSPMDKAGEVAVTDKIEIHFTGIVESSEIAKITVTSENSSVSGSWESSFGGTVWTFTPEALSGDTVYTLSIPSDFAGNNGVAMGKAYTLSFETEKDSAKYLGASGEYYTFTAPKKFTFGNTYVFRFLVTNDAANRAMLYAVDGEGDTEGELLGSVNLRGAGTYEIDVTDYIAAKADQEVTLMLKAENAKGEREVLNSEDGSAIYNLPSKNKNSKVTFKNGVTIGEETAVSVYVSTPTPKPNADNPLSVYYDNPTHLFTYSGIMGGFKTTPENYGRRFTVEFDVYDTVERVMRVQLNTMTKRVDYGTIDYDHVFFNVKTKANGWTHVEFTYNVYEPDYGFASYGNSQSLAVYLSPTGYQAAGEEKLAYINGLKVAEITTEMTVGNAFLAEKEDGTGISYKAPQNAAKPLAVYNGETKVGEYSTLAEAFAAYTSGYTLKLQSDYTLTDSGIYSGMGSFAEINIDLNGYTVYSMNTTGAFLWLKSTTKSATVINVSGGAIRLGRCALISYADSTLAGAGKAWGVKLDCVYIGLTENSFATELLSTSALPSGAETDVNVEFNNCIFDIPDEKRARDAAVLFTSPASKSLGLTYDVTGGEIRLSSQRWITVIDNAMIVEFHKDASDNYTVLKMPESITTSVSGSYLTKDGYAKFDKAASSEYITTYTLECDENSTLYGVITDDYLDDEAYPFLVFKNGVLISGEATFAAAITKANGYLKGTDLADEKVEILLRRDFVNTGEASFGSTNGTILIDLGGHTLSRSSTLVNAVVNSSTVFTYPTSVIFTNGRLDVMKDKGVIGVTHCLIAASSTKTFNVTFDKVTFGFGAQSPETITKSEGIFWSMWQNGYDASTVTNLTLKDCTLDLVTNAPANGATLFKLTNTEKGQVNFKMLGGEIISSGAEYTFATTDSKDSVLVGLGSGGKLPTLKVKSGGAVIDYAFRTESGDYTNFTTDGSTEGGYDLYELTVNQNVTDYGMIPGTYENAESYPFVLFMDGQFVGAYGTWKAATQGAGTALDGKSDKTAYLLMRRDYNNTGDSADGGSINKVNGTLVVDLGAHTFTRGANIFDMYYYKSNTAPVNMIIKNGSLRTLGKPIFANQINADTESAVKSWNVTVTGVTLGFAEGAESTGETFVTTWTNPVKDADKVITTPCTMRSHTTLVFKDCTFDLNTNRPTTKPTLFDLSDNNGYDLVKTDIVIEGGEIICDSLKNVTIATKNEGTDSVTFTKSGGKYATLTATTTAKDASHYTGAFDTPEGTMYYVEIADDGVNSTYVLDKMTFGELSAPITAKYLSALDYPFFVFSDSSFSSAKDYWRNAIDAAKELVNDDSEKNVTANIVLRRDYDVSKTNTAGKSDAGSNFNNAKGKISIDLNGKTINNVDTYFIDVYFEYKNASYLGYKSTVEIKGGTLKNSRATFPMIALGHSGTTADDDTKELEFIFKDVDFAFGTGAEVLIREWKDHTGDGLNVSYLFDECRIDFANAKSGAIAFDFLDTNKKTLTTATFKGGLIKADDLNSYSVVKNNSEENVTFIKNDSGSYTKAELPLSAPDPTATFKSESGETLSFGKESIGAQSKIYVLGENVFIKYGSVPFAYTNAEFYPFLVFDKNGAFLGADDTFLDTVAPTDNEGAIHIAKSHMQSNSWNGTDFGSDERSATILMRADYSMASTETYNNLAQIIGTATVDLDGHTLTAYKTRTLFGTSIKPWGERGIYPTTITVKDGTVEIFDAPLIKVETWTGSDSRPDDYVKDKKFTYNFEGVSVKALGTADKIVSQSSVGTGTPNAVGNLYVEFTDSTIDVSESKAASLTVMNSGNGLTHVTVTYRGGSIIAKEGVTIFDGSADAEGSLSFERGKDGKLTSLRMISGKAPLDEYSGSLGKLVFVSEGVNTYRLTPKAAAEFGVKKSITLSSDLILNVYVEAIDELLSFKIAGKIYEKNDFASLTTEVIEGETYYKVSVSLASYNALDDVALSAKISLADGSELESVRTLNAVDYAKSVIAGEGSEKEKTLALDMLSYIRAAYAYFGSANTAKLAEIDEILGDEYDDTSAPDLTADAKTPAAGSGLSGATLKLGATADFIFILDKGCSASDFTFRIGDTALKVTDCETYVIVEAPLGSLTETVSFEGKNKDGETVSGEYNVMSYYAWAAAEGNEKSSPELIKLLERLIKYSESAKAFSEETANG